MSTTETNWKQYCDAELALLQPILAKSGYQLFADQPHLKGERYLMQAVSTTSGPKLILLGTDHSGARVVIKASRDPSGQAELKHEQSARTLLNKMQFAAEVFHIPEERDWLRKKGFLIAVQQFIEQPCQFLERPTAEQFDFALSAFTAQEGTHATTYKHRQSISRVFEIRSAESYQKRFAAYAQNFKTALPEETTIAATLQSASALLEQEAYTIAQYSGFLTHTDFVPHNFRIAADGTMYLLDHSSLCFGNKYEGWARFINFMELYNQELAKALCQYVKDNRATEEVLALKLMRIYRLGEIIWYYTDKLQHSEDNLLQLNTARIHFWSDMLLCIINDTEIPHSLITAYQEKRDSLRSDDEKDRQQNLH
ncbi:hypothetical protein N9L26_01705 [Candidatus Pacebacteria bacterium]|nr:hypothetical protein [Candidatus Paceibacterota bacterium]